MCILPEISAHHLQLKCMGGHFFRCHPYIERSTTVLSDIAVKFEYCLLLDTVPAENISTVNETE